MHSGPTYHAAITAIPVLSEPFSWDFRPSRFDDLGEPYARLVRFGFESGHKQRFGGSAFAILSAARW